LSQFPYPGPPPNDAQRHSWARRDIKDLQRRPPPNPRYEIKLSPDFLTTLSAYLAQIGDTTVFKWTMPVDFDQLRLWYVLLYVTTPGGPTTCEIENVTQGKQFLSTSVTIPAGDYDSDESGPTWVIDNTVRAAARDRVWINVTAAGSAEMGLGIVLQFGL